jgi:Amt family ammonium transporter
MLEAGTVRHKNVTEIIIKNIADANITAFCFWAFGYSLAFVPSDNGFAGGSGSIGLFSNSIADYGGNIQWFMQWCFVSTCTSIVSGAVAERCKMICYIAYSALMSSVVYPIIAYWVWSERGWLSPFNADLETRLAYGVIDFAGCGVVHMTGGCAALIGAYFVGPRKGCFYRSNDNKVVKRAYTMNSQVARAIGAFSLWFGWFFFNSGTAFTFDATGAENVLSAGNIAVNTLLSAASGAFAAAIIGWYYIAREGGPVSFFNQLNTYLINGLLAGLVSITSSCAVVTPGMAVVIGIIGSVIMCYASTLLHTCEIDDVVDAMPVHLASGIWGLLAAALFAKPALVEKIYGFSDVGGLFYDGSSYFLGTASLFILCSLAWNAAIMVPFFWGFKVIGLLKYNDAEVDDLLDARAHGTSLGYKHSLSSSQLDEMGRDFNVRGPSPTQIGQHRSSADAAGKGARPVEQAYGLDSSIGSSNRAQYVPGGIEQLEMGKIGVGGGNDSNSGKYAPIDGGNSNLGYPALNLPMVRSEEALAPAIIEAYIQSKRSLDRSALIGLALTNGATKNIMILLDIFEQFAGGSHEISGESVEEFKTLVRASYKVKGM